MSCWIPGKNFATALAYIALLCDSSKNLAPFSSETSKEKVKVELIIHCWFTHEVKVAIPTYADITISNLKRMGSGNRPFYFITRCQFVIKIMFVKGMGSYTTFSGWIHLQHTRIAVAFACWNFLLFLGLKTIKTFKRQRNATAIRVCCKWIHH